MMTILDDQRVQTAKRSFAVRRVPLSALRAIDSQPRRPLPGDVVLARVLEVGRLARVELPTGRKSALYVGDEVILTYGHRYAADAYGAEVPPNLGLCELAAAGGLAGRITTTNAGFAGDRRPPTLLKPEGLFVGNDGRAINLRDFAFEPTPPVPRSVPVITVFGASMNAGKTTTAAGIMHGLARQGLKVGAAKITGTCSGGDLWKFLDAGAAEAYDFTDMGLATTFREEVSTIVEHAGALVARLEASGCDVVVLEIADGVFQVETAGLLGDVRFRALVDHWVFAADSAPSILAGLNVASGFGIELAAISGSITASPLAVREACELVSANIVGLDELEAGFEALAWLRGAPQIRSQLIDILPDAVTERLAAG